MREDLLIQCTYGTGLGQDMNLAGQLLPPLAVCLLCCDLHHSAERFRPFSSACVSSSYGNEKNNPAQYRLHYDRRFISETNHDDDDDKNDDTTVIIKR